MNAHQRQIKDRIKICLYEDGIVLTASDAKINTGKILFWKKNANLSTRQINQLYSIHVWFNKADPTHISWPKQVEIDLEPSNVIYPKVHWYWQRVVFLTTSN